MKVVPKHSGAVVEATVETLSLEQPSIVHLQIAPENVSRFERRGADLALVLQDGSVTVLRGFFSVYPDNGRNDLVLEDDAGVMWWGQYTSPWTQFSFTEIEWLDAVAAVPVTDGLPGWLIAGLGVLGLGAAAGGGGGGGGGFAPPLAPVNRSPSAEANPLEVRVGRAGQGRVDARDPDGDAVTFTVNKVPANGDVTIDPRTGEFVYTPRPGYVGTDSFDVTVSDGKGGTATISVPVTVTNDAPIPADPNAGLEPGNPVYVDGQTFDPLTGNYGITTPEDTPFVGKVVGDDADGDDLTYTKGSDPANGTVVVNEDGTYTYTPGKDFNGTDKFTVIVDDGNGGKTTSTVTVDVTPVNDAPIPADPNAGLEPGDPVYLDGQTFDPLTGNYGITTPEDTPFVGKVVGDDADGDDLTYTKGSDPANGTVVVNEDGSYTYTPNPNFNGTDTFTVFVDDGKGGTSTSTVTVSVTPVNDAPVALNDGPVPVTEDTPATGNVLTNDSDPDVGTTLTVTKFTVGTTSYDAGQTATITGVGTLVINGNGVFTFTPAPNYTGALPSATYTVSDGTLTDTAVLSFGNVTPVNDAPVAIDPNEGLDPGDPTYVPGQSFDPETGNYGHTTVEDEPVAGRVTGSDADGDTLTYAKGDDPVNGTVVVNESGTYTYTPAANYSGTDQFTVTISDGKGGTTTSTVTINVTPVTDAPAVVAQVEFNLSGAQLTTHTWSGITTVNANGTTYNLGENGGDGASAATLKGAIDYLMSQGGGVEGPTTTLTSTTLPTNEAKLITGFMYLEAGQTYEFSGKVDDSGMLVIGDAAEAHVNWKGTSTGVDSQFTVEKSGFYTFDLYLHNASGAGNYNFNVVNVNGSDVPLFGSVAQIQSALVPGYMALNGFDDGVDNDSKGFYELVEAYTHKSTQAAGEPIALTGVEASSTDSDGSETLSMTLTGLPDGTVLTYTNHFADGSTSAGSATVQGGSVEVIGDATVVSFDNLQVDVPDGVGGVHQVTMTVTVQDGTAAPQSSVVEFDVNSELNADPIPLARMSVQEEDPSHGEDATEHPQSNAADSTDSSTLHVQPQAESLGLANLDADAFQADEPQEAHEPVLSELLVADQGQSSLDALLSFLPPGSAVTGASSEVGQPTSESVAYTPPVSNPLDDDLHHATLMAA